MKRFTADFETATWDPNETWVWAWATCEIGNFENIEIGNDIETFFEFCQKEKNPVIYFHNEKFDGEFIIYYLLTHGFSWIEDKKEAKEKTFTTVISDMGQFYSIEVYFEKGNKTVKKVTFYDSLKIIPFSVSEIAKAFNLKESKLKIDYNMERPKGWRLTLKERQYITNDVVIVAKALHELFSEKLTKMTQASNALSNYKEILTLRKFEHYFPSLDYEVWKDMRPFYKGRFYIFKSNL